MGCWNHTCAITKLPIFHTDPVYVFLLVKQEPNNYRTHPTSFWAPIPYYFEGEYNDYGGVENCHGPLLPTVLEQVKTVLVEMDEGDNPYHDIEIRKDKFNIESLFEADHTHRLFLHSRTCKKPVEMTHVVIKKSVVDFILQNYKFEQFVRCDNTYGYEYRDVTFNTILQQSDKWYDHFISLPDDQQERSLFMYHGGDDRLFDRIKSVTKYSSILTFPDLFIFDCYRRNHLELIKPILYQQSVLYWITSFMDSIRHPWAPCIGLGSQESDIKPYQLLTTIIATECDNIKARFEEDEDEE